jgi:hypothetical protein
MKKLTPEAAIFAINILPTAFPQAYVAATSVTLGPTHQNAGTLPNELSKYADVFDPTLSRSLKDGAEHVIEIIADPPFGPIYNLSVRELEELRRYIDEALARGGIQHSTSPAGAPILFVPKKDGGLNKVTVKNRHALPLISEILDRVQRAKRFSKIDLENAFHSMRIRSDDVWKTAFRTKYGHFEYLAMPFGLTNVPASFQAYMNKALVGLVDIICVVYLDDILVFSEDPEEHLRHVVLVRDRLRRYGLCAKVTKCVFDVEQVDFLDTS